MINIRIKKLTDNAVIPSKAHPSDAGFDLVATSRSIDEFGNVVYGTGLAMEIPEGYAGFIFPRSSICKKDLALSNSVGIVDSGYRGEIMCKFRPVWKTAGMSSIHKHKTIIDGNPLCDIYAVGDRIAQLIVMPYPGTAFTETDTLSDSDRGAGGYGSTGN